MRFLPTTTGRILDGVEMPRQVISIAWELSKKQVGKLRVEKAPVSISPTLRPYVGNSVLRPGGAEGKENLPNQR